MGRKKYSLKGTRKTSAKEGLGGGDARARSEKRSCPQHTEQRPLTKGAVKEKTAEGGGEPHDHKKRQKKRGTENEVATIT